MYECEANHTRESIEQIPAPVIAQFEEINTGIVARTLLPWCEHCTECAAPQCYQTCDLYAPRLDGKCRRFVDGMVRIDGIHAIAPYVLKISFKRWGKLLAYGNSHLFPLEQANHLEQSDLRISHLLNQSLIPSPIRRNLIQSRYSWKKKRSQFPGKNTARAGNRWKDTVFQVLQKFINQVSAQPYCSSYQTPSYFMLECYNPNQHVVDLSFTIQPQSQTPPYQHLLHVQPGFKRYEIDAGEICAIVPLDESFTIELVPNDISDGCTLYFGIMDFVVDVNYSAPKPQKKTKCKCVVWDLDNTLWDGILIEDGAEKLQLKSGIRDIIQELDSRGILQSVASKNNRDEAMEVLRRFNIDTYFLYPQISWDPKSFAIQEISRSLNIGIDTILFVDDSEFERSQVQHELPDVHVLDSQYVDTLPDLDFCQVELTEESKNRRRMYQEESIRKSESRKYEGNYMQFLKDCHIELEITPFSHADLQRVHELTQRTNQMNFSGNRYEQESLVQILEQEALHAYVMRCGDRYGNYGIVGFAVIDARQPALTDLMFSCRIQSKRVEHAFMTFILNKYRNHDDRDFIVHYRKTEKNMKSAQVFQDFGMESLSEKVGVLTLVFRKEWEIPDDQILTVQFHELQGELQEVVSVAE
ncbi:MAG: HAD-IIIC family phosphatase [bacterium]|jgi:FkbH-like protein